MKITKCFLLKNFKPRVYVLLLIGATKPLKGIFSRPYINSDKSWKKTNKNDFFHDHNLALIV
jgi:hypothetical protein